MKKSTIGTEVTIKIILFIFLDFTMLNRLIRKLRIIKKIDMEEIVINTGGIYCCIQVITLITVMFGIMILLN